MTTSPYKWLQDLERRAKQRAKGLPHQSTIEQIWRGIAFRLGKIYLVSPLNEISEIIPYTHNLAKVPGAKSWIKGLANIRGLLLPIIDLKACLEGESIAINNRSRMLIINQSGISAGLLVDEVLGIKHFPEHLMDLETPCKDVLIAPFAKGLFVYEKDTWTIFDMQKLTNNNVFLNAAL
ncbi:chemotaxis protein CheW [Candidatus Halobeggiatoa sp. HSG11]|nr:chemotaxis protein CheW [Candidatus Halobeggiatoa sp. HSG11]